ncbi:uncharacterized protein LOC734367 isoform X1 [Xenopus laevis]|uniref:Surfeit locus protein 2 n=2 Tax=Xenopus laevis TaxID=8355 RepID=A0A974C2J3_XENLA|nr:uncharacterized protein LOC734367 isoform X1 [Xenopus laevis]OCT65348.1 hypothetical protein XELAEV_18041587mg [Xenopus laevis]
MDGLPEDVRLFLQQHPSLQLIAGNKVRCVLTGHELPCRLPELQSFTGGKKYQKLTCSSSSFDFSSYEPHIVPSTKNPKQLFCKLTLRHINRIPEHVQRHVQGKRYARALRRYEECKRQGLEFVPACLLNKSKPKHKSGSERPKVRRDDMWEPQDSDSEDSDSADSMSDLYPAQMFTQKNLEKEQADSFQLDSDEEEMEVKPPQNANKRQQRQNGPTKKKFKKQHRKSKHFKKSTTK